MCNTQTTVTTLLYYTVSWQNTTTKYCYCKSTQQWIAAQQWIRKYLSAVGIIWLYFLLQGFLYCFLRIICTSNCCETVSQTPIRKMSRQHKDNFFKGVKRKWKSDNDQEKNCPIVSIHRDYDNYYSREFVAVRKKPSLESLSVTQLLEETTNSKKSNDHANAILSNWTTERI